MPPIDVIDLGNDDDDPTRHSRQNHSNRAEATSSTTAADAMSSIKENEIWFACEQAIDTALHHYSRGELFQSTTSESDKSVVLENYRLLKNSINKIVSGGIVTLRDITVCLKLAESIHRLSQLVTIEILDAELLYELSQLVSNHIRYSQQVISIQPTEIIEKIRAKFGISSESDCEVDWDACYKLFAGNWKHFVAASELHSSITHIQPPKERKPRVRRGVDQLTKATAALIQTADTDESAMSTQRLVSLEKLLQTYPNQPLPFWIVILNPESYGQSIENLFDLSFLVKSGKVAIVTDEEDKQQYIHYLSQTVSSEEFREKGVTKMQAVLTLDYSKWGELIQLHQITEPWVPTRPGAPDIRPFAEAFLNDQVQHQLSPELTGELEDDENSEIEMLA